MKRGSIAAGKVADLVLVSGAPHQNVNDIERIARVFLGGREIDREAFGAPHWVEGAVAPGSDQGCRTGQDDFVKQWRLRTTWTAPQEIRCAAPWARSGSTVAIRGTTTLRLMMGRTLRRDDDHALYSRAHVHGPPPLHPGQHSSDSRRLGAWPMRASLSAASASTPGATVCLTGSSSRPARCETSPIFQAPFKAGGSWETIRIEFGSLEQGNGQGA